MGSYPRTIDEGLGPVCPKVRKGAQLLEGHPWESWDLVHKQSARSSPRAENWFFFSPGKKVGSGDQDAGGG